MCCTRLAGNTGRKNRHLRTLPQLCRAISSQLRHVSTIGKKLIKQQYIPHMSPQYSELRPTSGWNLLASLGHPCKFQRVSRLGSVTARHSSRGRQPNFAALNRGRHLYSAGRPSGWALAHILVLLQIYCWVCFERIFKIARRLAKLSGKSDCLKCSARRGTVLLKLWKMKNSLEIWRIGATVITVSRYVRLIGLIITNLDSVIDTCQSDVM